MGRPAGVAPCDADELIEVLQTVAVLCEARAGRGQRAVGDDVGTRHEPAVVRRQPRRDACDIGWLAAVGPRLESPTPLVGGVGIATVEQSV